MSTLLKIISKLKINSKLRGSVREFRYSSDSRKIHLRSDIASKKIYATINRGECTNVANSSTILTPDKVFRSPLEDVKNFTGVYMHDFVWEYLDRHSNKTALLCAVTGKSYSYTQLRKACGRFATFLRKNNLRPGDTIAIILPNVPEYAIILLGASEAGIQITVVNPNYTVDEIARQLKNSKSTAVATITSKYSVVKESLADYTSLKLPVILVEEGTQATPAGAIKFEDTIRDDIEEFEKSGEKSDINTEDTFLLPYSSGTSGLPKGVELSHRNIVANLLQNLVESSALIRPATDDHQEVVPLILPVYHIYGLVICLQQYLRLGGKIVCLPQLTPDDLFRVLDNHRFTVFYVVPPLIQIMSNDERLMPQQFERIKLLVSGAAPIGSEALTRFLSRTRPDLKIVQGYGLTECSPAIAIDIQAPMSSVGHPMPNTEIRIVDSTSETSRRNLGIGETGEIFVRGPQVMKGYYNNPEATAATMDGDWLRTGDLGSFDKNGHLYITGRVKELIKVQGYQVAPAELEDLIIGHGKVSDVAVMGVPHEKYGEIPKAFIVPKKDSKLGVDELKDWVAERVVKYKKLGHVEFVDRIPKSAAGKILRRELAKM